jgi:hypothetical protein
MSKPWWIDVLTAGIVLAWMAWTFATMQTHGPSLELIGSAVIVGVVGILWIYGQRITYLQIKNWIVVGMERDQRDDQRELRNRGDE